MTEAKVVELIKEWKDEMKGVVADYNAMLKKLDAAITLAQDSEKKWWVVHKNLVTFVVTVLTLLVFVIGVSMTMRFTNVCVVNVSPDTKAAALNSCKSTE